MSSSFTVTTGRDGSRFVGDHDDRWVPRSRGRGSHRGGSWRGNRNNSGKMRGGGGGGYSRGSRWRGNYKGGYHNRGQGRGVSPRSRLDDEGDADMGENGSDKKQHKRYSPYGSRPRNNRSYTDHDRPVTGGGGGSKGTLQRLGLPFNSSGGGNQGQWFRVLIPGGKNFSKDQLINAVQSHIDTPVVPVQFHCAGLKAIFYIQDKTLANELRGVSGKFTLPGGTKLIFLVKASDPPRNFQNASNFNTLTEDSIEKLKVSMSNRYDPATKFLNLCDMFHDQDLNQAGLRISMSKTENISEAVKIIIENIPELVGLDLSNNMIRYLEPLSRLVPPTPNLTKLNISRNKLQSIHELKHIKDWKLEELTIDGNELCDKFSDQTTYISAIRKMFPKVLKLDGHDLPPPITFEIEAESDLPPTKGSFFPTQDVQNMVIKFLKDFFTVYDTDNREGLIEAYDEQATFSMTCSYNPANEYTQHNLHDYKEHSRNMIKGGKDPNRRNRLIRQGRVSVVAHLCQLPKTTHDYNSLVVDVSTVQPTMMSFSVSGVFKESDSKSDRAPIRAFSRLFVAVPSGPSMAIVNDMLTVTNASHEQVQKSFKSAAPTPSTSPVPEAAPPSAFEKTPEQQQMVLSFVSDSKMNSTFSEQCLRENGWDYQKAAKVFLDLQSQGKIPAEAFQNV